MENENKIGFRCKEFLLCQHLTSKHIWIRIILNVFVAIVNRVKPRTVQLGGYMFSPQYISAEIVRTVFSK